MVPKREELARKRRQSLKSQAEVAYMIGISQTNYWNIENGYTKPTPTIAAKLIKMFQLPNDYFTKGV